MFCSWLLLKVYRVIVHFWTDGSDSIAKFKVRVCTMYILCLQNIFHPISVSRKEGDPLSKAYDGTVYLYSSVFRLLRSFCYSLKWHTLIMHSIFHIIVKKTGFLDWSKHWLKFWCFSSNIMMHLGFYWSNLIVWRKY